MRAMRAILQHMHACMHACMHGRVHESNDMNTGDTSHSFLTQLWVTIGTFIEFFEMLVNEMRREYKNDMAR